MPDHVELLEGESKCAACHRIGSGCCSDEIFMTLHDVLRVSQKTNIPVDDLVVFKKVSEDLSEANEDGVFEELYEDGKILMLKQPHQDRYDELEAQDVDFEEGDDYGACRFLNKEGCSIFDQRPRVCRLMPLWYEKDKNGEIKIFLDEETDPEKEFCLICKDNSGNLQGALKDLDEDLEDLKKYAKEYDEELEVYKKYKHHLGKKKPSEIIKDYDIKVQPTNCSINGSSL